MAISDNYTGFDKSIWQGRVDDPRDLDSYRWHQLISGLDLTSKVPETQDHGEKGFCFLGFCCDEGVEKNLGRPGAAKAPFFIRKEMANLPRTFGGNVRLFDAGNIICQNKDLEQSQADLSHCVARVMSLNLFPVLLGGGHELALGHFTGLQHFISTYASNKKKIGIVNFDAHFDLRPYNRGANSGTMFLQVADKCREAGMEFNYFCVGAQMYGNTVSLFKKADELGTEYIMAKDINDTTLTGHLDRLEKFCSQNDLVYVTLCADVFSSAFAPGVSSPQPFGLYPETVLKLLKRVLRSGKVASFDIAEVSPRFDEDNRTAKLAAIVIFALINTLADVGRPHYF